MSTDEGAAGGAGNRAMVEELRAAGLLGDARVADAMLAVPRHVFAPAAGWLSPDRGAGPGRPVNRRADPAAWWATVYSDGSIITQREDGAAAADAAEGTPTSSLSAPGVVAEFLELLAVRPRDRVLEIGTGTGWTAAPPRRAPNFHGEGAARAEEARAVVGHQQQVEGRAQRRAWQGLGSGGKQTRCW